MNKFLEGFTLLAVIALMAGFWVLLAPQTYWERASTFAFEVVYLALFVFFIHIWRTKWKDK